MKHKCIRCGKDFNVAGATLNAQIYGSNVLACPHCGKAYSCERIENVSIIPISYTNRVEDDWGNEIVNDEDCVKKENC